MQPLPASGTLREAPQAARTSENTITEERTDRGVVERVSFSQHPAEDRHREASAAMSRAMAITRPWTVNKAGPLTQVDERLWIIDDEVPGLPGATRRMTIVKRLDGSLLFYNAIPVEEPVLDAIRALGNPAQLILPNQFHALDAAAFAVRLNVTAYCPEVGVPKLADRLTCQPITALPLDAQLKVFRVEGFSTHEAVIVAGNTLIVADLLTNAPHGRGFKGLMMRFVGFTGPQPKLPAPVQRRVGKDLRAVAALMNELAGVPGLTRIIPSHGLIIESGAPEALRAVAASLKS